VTTVVWRDVNKAAEGLTEEVGKHVASGWDPQGGIASVEAGSSVYLLQAMIRRR
jgi:hypothetical protein